MSCPHLFIRHPPPQFHLFSPPHSFPHHSSAPSLLFFQNAKHPPTWGPLQLPFPLPVRYLRGPVPSIIWSLVLCQLIGGHLWPLSGTAITPSPNKKILSPPLCFIFLLSISRLVNRMTLDVVLKNSTTHSEISMTSSEICKAKDLYDMKRNQSNTTEL